jgi:hypothetical protein
MAQPSPLETWEGPEAVLQRPRQLAGAAATPVSEGANSSLAGKFLGFLLTFIMVNLGWAFFCMDLPTSMFFFRRLFFG